MELGSPGKRVLPPSSKVATAGLANAAPNPHQCILRATEVCQEFDTSNGGGNAMAF